MNWNTIERYNRKEANWRIIIKRNIYESYNLDRNANQQTLSDSLERDKTVIMVIAFFLYRGHLYASMDGCQIRQQTEKLKLFSKGVKVCSADGPRVLKTSK